MALAPLTAQLPSLAGTLPDLFRRPDATRGDETTRASAPQAPAGDPATDAEPRASSARTSDDAARTVARRAALGPLTYGRRTPATDATPAAPIGMRGIHLDVRG
jgi:hypothetical protein